MSIHLFPEKPPKDRRQKKRYSQDKQKYPLYQRLYGDSLVGGADQQKTIVARKSGSRKKKRERKEPKTVSFVKENIIEASKS